MATAKKTDTVQTQPVELKQYQVQWLLSHNGKDFNTGDILSLSDDEAAPLLRSGVITLQG